MPTFPIRPSPGSTVEASEHESVGVQHITRAHPRRRSWAALAEHQQQLDQIQDVRHAVAVDILPRVAGRSGRQTEAEQQVDQVEDLQPLPDGEKDSLRRLSTPAQEPHGNLRRRGQGQAQPLFSRRAFRDALHRRNHPDQPDLRSVHD